MSLSSELSPCHNMKLSFLLTAVLFLNTIGLLLYNQRNPFYLMLFSLMTLVGSIGHSVLRKYILNLPDIEKTLVNRLLVVISYGVQFLTLKKCATEILDILLPVWTRQMIENYPKFSCFVFSVPMFAFGCLQLLGTLVAFVMTLRNSFPAAYLEANHVILRQRFFFVLAGLISIPYIVQLVACKSFCNESLFRKLMVNTFRNISRSDNIFGQEECWIPFFPVLNFICIFLFSGIAVIKVIIFLL